MEPHKMPSRYKHDVEDADAETVEALRELLPVVRGEKDIRFVLASIVDRLHRVHEFLKDVQFEKEENVDK